MPLVMVCGYPCSGKTSFAHELRDYLLSEGGVKSVEVVNEESEKQSRGEGYKDSASEKRTRGLLKSAVDRSLTADCFVICDSLNYIKGFRYELHCIARTLRTPHCTVWVQCSESASRARAERRLAETGDGYPPQVFNELRLRFEAPNDKNRWDTPLFVVDMTGGGGGDDVGVGGEAAPEPGASAADTAAAVAAAAAATETVFASTSSWRAAKNGGGDTATTASSSTFRRKAPAAESGALSFSGTIPAQHQHQSTQQQQQQQQQRAQPASAAFGPILAHLTSQPVLQPNSSTLSVPRGSASVLFELDAATQDIVARIAAHQDCGAAEAAPLLLPEYGRTLGLHRTVGLAELQRHRRQFVSLQSKRPPTMGAEGGDERRILGANFIDFLGTQL